MTQDEYGAARAVSLDAGAFKAHLATLAGLMAPVYSRRDLRENAIAYVRGLLCPDVPGNCWALAQAAGHARAYRLQHLLSGAV